MSRPTLADMTRSDAGYEDAVNALAAEIESLPATL